ncbi:MAG: hypothetical protein ACM3JI_03315 [Anaerolineae bacterium]
MKQQNKPQQPVNPNPKSQPQQKNQPGQKSPFQNPQQEKKWR